MASWGVLSADCTLFYLCKAADSIDAKCKSSACDQCITKFLDEVPSGNIKKRRSRDKSNPSRCSKFCPCGSDDNVLCDRLKAIEWLRKLCRGKTEPPDVLMRVNLKEQKKYLIYSHPLFCLVCQRILGEEVRGILVEEVKEGYTKQKQNWHQLLAKAHTTWG